MLAEPFPEAGPLPGAYRLHLPPDGLTIWYTVTESPDKQVVIVVQYRDQFYAARLRTILRAVYSRGNAQLRERIEGELRLRDQPEVKPEKELPDPAGILDEVTTFVELARDGACMAGDRRVHHTERSMVMPT